MARYVSVQQDTMTLSGYDKIWSVADAHRTPKKDSEIEGDEYVENYIYMGSRRSSESACQSELEVRCDALI